MEAINDASKLIAKSVELIKGYIKPPVLFYDETPLVNSIDLLEQALAKLTDNM